MKYQYILFVTLLATSCSDRTQPSFPEETGLDVVRLDAIEDIEFNLDAAQPDSFSLDSNSTMDSDIDVFDDSHVCSCRCTRHRHRRGRGHQCVNHGNGHFQD